MTRTTCDPCDACSIPALAKGNETFKQAVLRILCGILEATGGVVGTGYLPGSRISTTGTNATIIKNGPGILGNIDGSNVNAEEAYVKIYDKATTPNPAVDTPVYRYLIPGRTTGAGSNVPFPSSGIQFQNGISYIITSGVADNDTTGVLANEVIVNYGYK